MKVKFLKKVCRLNCNLTKKRDAGYIMRRIRNEGDLHDQLRHSSETGL